VNKDKIHEFELPHPKQEDLEQQDIPLQGYTYMKWPFGKGRTLFTRGQLHSYEDYGIASTVNEAGEKEKSIKYSNIYAMNQWRITKKGWSSIDSDKTAILSQELTDNANRVSKWAFQSMLAGADNMKIVFVTRQKLMNNEKHQILGTSTISTQKFIDLISYKLDECWSNVKYVVDYFEKQEDGEYIIIRDPIKSSLKIYRKNYEGEDENGDFAEKDKE
jgi:translation initiation factor 3 subunit D